MIWGFKYVIGFEDGIYFLQKLDTRFDSNRVPSILIYGFVSGVMMT